MNHQTLVLTPWLTPHEIVPWEKGVFQLVTGKVFVLEAYPDEIVRSAYLEFPLPSVACLKRPPPGHKNGVKFSRINVMTRDNFTCQYCGRRLPMRELNYDHVLPRIKGGKTVWENIVTCCYLDNEKKGSRTPEQAGMRLLRKPFKPKSLPITPAVWKTNQMPQAWAPYLENAPLAEVRQTA
jgi:5-methylcytosine-specific restriction endonuclease McrA